MTSRMRARVLRRTSAASGAVVLAAVLLHGQGRPASRAGTVDWPLHNLDTHNSRYATLDEINAGNAGKLAVKWTFETAKTDGLGATTPVVMNGVMYFNAGSKLFAVDAETGKSRWTYEAPVTFAGGRRGPASGDGVIYAVGQRYLYAVDATSGKALESFGDKGVMSVGNKALEFKYPGKYKADLDPVSIGYSIVSAPTFANGVVYLGLASAEMMIRGGLVVAMDAKTGAIKWVFNTIPQGPQDDGWDIVKDTWGGGAMVGGGIWTQPAVDVESGLVFVNVSNPTPAYDGSVRKGQNLFTDSVVALKLDSGKLAWYFQTVHHDIWDWETVTGPILFETTVRGERVKALATFGKACYGYMLNRVTGAPLNPIVESPVPQLTDVPGEQPWPTQPIPYTARGVPQTPFCMTYPIVTDPELAKRVRPSFHPYLMKEYIITAPSNQGGGNWGSPSFSPRTGLVYVTGHNEAHSLKPQPVGDSMAKNPGPDNIRHPDVAGPRGPTGVTPSTGMGAYNPGTGELVWYKELPGTTNSGNMVTAGDLVFQAIGDFFALDARTGREVFRYPSTARLGSSPMTYQVKGKQFVAVSSGNAVLAFGLR